jgi:dienelactone hydrolase
LVAVPQSTQALWKGAYVWNDYDLSREEIRHHIASIQRQYAVDPERLVIGGHSMGGEVAIRLALSGEVQATGFVAIGPGGLMVDDPEQLTPLIEASAGSGLRGFFIWGDDDRLISAESIQRLIDRLNENDIPTDLEIVPGAGHDFVPDYEEALLRGLDFIILE